MPSVQSVASVINVIELELDAPVGFTALGDMFSEPVQNLNSETAVAQQMPVAQRIENKYIAERVVYQAEKHLGHRSESGYPKLKKLTPRHYKILALHIQGRSAEQVAFHIGCSIGSVYRIIEDPLSKEILSRVYAHRQQEIDALTGEVLNTLRAGLADDIPLETRLKAVDRFMKVKQHIGPAETHTLTAEDIISGIFARASIQGDVNVQVNVGSRE